MRLLSRNSISALGTMGTLLVVALAAPSPAQANEEATAGSRAEPSPEMVSLGQAAEIVLDRREDLFQGGSYADDYSYVTVYCKQGRKTACVESLRGANP